MPTTPANESCPSDVEARQLDRVPAHAGYASGREDRHVFLYAFDLIEAAVRLDGLKQMLQSALG
jgi:hypothetical protein